MSGSDYQVRLRKVMKNPLLKRRQFVSTPHNIYTYFKRKRRRQTNQYFLFYSSNIQKEWDAINLLSSSNIGRISTIYNEY